MNQRIRLCIYLLYCMLTPGIILSQPADAARELTIRDAVERTLHHSFETSKQDALLRIAMAEREQAGLLANPDVNYSIERLLRQSDDVTEWTLAADYPLLTFLTRGKRIGAADFAIQAASHRRLRSLEALAHNVRGGFVRVWESREHRTALQEIAAQLQALGSSATLRSDEGDLSAYEGQRLQNELSRLRWRLSEAGAAQRAAESELALLLAVPLDTLASYTLRLPLITSTAPDVAELQSSGIARREDLKGLRAEREALLKHSAWLGTRWMDDVRIGGGYKRQSDNFRGPVVTFSLPLPLFDRDQGNVHVAVSDAARVETGIRELEHGIALEIQRAYETYIRLQGDAAKLRLPSDIDARRLFTAAVTAYKEGEFSLVEFLDAIRAHLDSAELRTAVRAALLRAAFNLEHAVGGTMFTIQETN